MDPVSIRPSEMVEGGVVPINQNLTVKEARFVLFDYINKAGEKVGNSTCAAALTLVTDEGVESIQHYSAADPARFQPSSDGKSIVPVGEATAINKSSNFYVLMNALVSAGFDESKLGADISVLDGLYAFWIGVPEPSRPGLVRTEEQKARGPRIIAVPGNILSMPGEKKPAGGKGAASSSVDAEKATLDFIGKAVASGPITRQDLAVRVFSDLANDPNRDAVATLIYSPTIQALLVANGFKVDGENISKA
ncbi:MAG: hypothetical protein JRD68_07020 [Deltaproteobacteria bacterium]|nr:hypothetical protein [Deltaproteobacteria bacterium]